MTHALSCRNDTTQPWMKVCSDLICISENRFWKQKNLSESKKKHCKRWEDHVSAHHPTPNPHQHPTTSTTWQHQKAPCPRLKGLPPHFHSLRSTVRPTRGWFAGPVTPNRVSHMLHLCQHCLVRGNTRSHLRNPSSNQALARQSHFIMWVVAASPLFSSLHRWFCWYKYAHLHQLYQQLPMWAHTDGLYETDSFYFFCIEKEVGNAGNSCIKSYVNLASFHRDVREKLLKPRINTPRKSRCYFKTLILWFSKIPTANPVF